MQRLNRTKSKGELVTFQNTKGYHLDGILYEANKSRKTIVHVHGSYGNFYQAYFTRVMSKIYTQAGFNFLCFNLTCRDGFGEGYKGEDGFEYVGGAVSDFSTCVRDIEGAVQFVSEFSDKIILQGHSLGCDRVIYYLLLSSQDFDFILLAPCDSYNLQSKWLSSEETVEEQTNRLQNEQLILQDFDWLPIKEYGVYSSNEDYILPITRKALLSIITEPPFKLFNIANPADYFFEQSCLIYIGGEDKLQTAEPLTMFNYFRERSLSVEPCLVTEGDHMLKGCEEEVANKIILWLESLKAPMLDERQPEGTSTPLIKSE